MSLAQSYVYETCELTGTVDHYYVNLLNPSGKVCENGKLQTYLPRYFNQISSYILLLLQCITI